LAETLRLILAAVSMTNNKCFVTSTSEVNQYIKKSVYTWKECSVLYEKSIIKCPLTSHKVLDKGRTDFLKIHIILDLKSPVSPFILLT
jgi:hypothetical protein